MRRNEVINYFVEKFGYKSYLEVGVDNPNNCFNQIQVPRKVGVDPVKGGTFKGTSDEFFAQNKETFDVIFIDGLHTAEQAGRDIKNALAILNLGGTIFVHDTDPTGEAEQNEERTTRKWFGSVWKAWARLRAERTDLKMITLEMDCGIGVIRTGRQTAYKGPYETYADYVANRKKIHRFVDIESIK
jgi:hypothetical protein